MGIHSTHKQIHPLNSPNLRVDHPVAIFKSSTSKPLIPKPPNHHQHIINMRFTIASVAIMAGAVAAVPQYSVQPISQISDGQIQAPPATSAVGSAVPLPSPSDVSVPAGVTSALSSAADMTSTLAVTETASVTSVVVVPTATPVGPSGSMVTPIVGGNSTASATGSAAVSSTASSEESATSGVAGSSTESASAPESTGAAAGNMVSFGGLVFAIGAAVFA